MSRPPRIALIVAVVCFLAGPAIASGALQEILPKAERPVLTLYALYPNRRFVQPKLLRCIEFMQQWFAESGY